MPVAEIGSGGDCSGRPSFAVVASTPLGRLARTPRGFQNPSSHLPLPPLRRLVASAASPWTTVSPIAEIMSVAVGVDAPGTASPTVLVASVALRACRASRSVAPVAPGRRRARLHPTHVGWSSRAPLLPAPRRCSPPPPGFPVPFAHPAGAVPANSLHPPCPVLGLPPTQVPPALPPPPPSLRPLLRGKATPG
jgi:hypothetical protein